MKKRTSLISIAKEEMKQTLAGGFDVAPIDALKDSAQPGHQCSAWCHCVCYNGYSDGMNNWAFDGDIHAGNAYTWGGIAVTHYNHSTL